jgi:4-amino-4-deoxy-L-arabinose transferase-like glycosyltransferase
MYIYHSPVWWDEAVYIGMGKYIVSGGVFGYWEFFRPPLLPLIFSFLYLLHLPLIFLGQVIVFCGSLGCIILTYLLGEKILKGAGIFASIFLSITPIFFFFSAIPITDILSLFFALFSLYVFTKEKYILSGVFASIAFLLRFPQGLMFLSLILISIYNTRNKNISIWFKDAMKLSLSILVGFLPLTVLYLGFNYFFYGDMFKPVIWAGTTISYVCSYENFGTWYYVKELWRTAPMLFFALLAPLVFFKKEYVKSRETLMTILISALIFMSYFFWECYKEIRFSLAFIPYVSLLAGVSFMFFMNVFRRNKLLMFLLFTILAFAGIFFIYKNPSVDYDNTNYSSFYSKIENLKGSYISSTPIPVALSNISLKEIFKSYLGFIDIFNNREDYINGIILNTCDTCGAGGDVGVCKEASQIENAIKKPFQKTYDQTIGKCEYFVFEK